jgi:hypothetical protein
MSNAGPLQVKTVRGTPIRAYGRTLTPVVRVVSLVQHQATVRERDCDGRGWGALWVKPLAIVEHDGQRAHTMLIPDVTGTVLRQMALVALAIPALCLAAISIARRIRNH